MPEFAKIANMDKMGFAGRSMKTMSAKDAKNGFGLLLDTARAEPVMIEKHGRPVIVVLAVEEYERLKEVETRSMEPRRQDKTRS